MNYSKLFLLKVETFSFSVFNPARKKKKEHRTKFVCQEKVYFSKIYININSCEA